MTRTLLLVLLFVAGMAALPWLVRRMQQRHGRVGAASASAPRILSAIAVGPHQRVVTVELGGEGERTTLVLGVTPQSIRCLHTQVAQAAAPTTDGFSLAMAQATRGDGAAPAPAVAGRPEDAAHG